MTKDKHTKRYGADPQQTKREMEEIWDEHPLCSALRKARWHFERLGTGKLVSPDFIPGLRAGERKRF